MGLHVGAWNIQKQNGPDNEINFVSQKMCEIFLANEIHVFFFEELANRNNEGHFILEIVARHFNDIVPPTRAPVNFQFEYQPGREDRGSLSSCNIGLIYDRYAFDPRHNVRVEYLRPPGFTRPVPTLQHGLLGVGGIHAKSGAPGKASKEIFTACTELGRFARQCVLIGDMNIPFDTDTDDETGLQSMRWERTQAGNTPTYGGNTRYPGADLDYCWSSPRLGPRPITLPRYGPTEFRKVDHAPVLYDFVGIPVPVR